MSELEYFLSVENIEISLYAQARQSLLLLTQGNMYNCLRFLNKWLMFLEELNEVFGENWSKFLTAGYLRASFFHFNPGDVLPLFSPFPVFLLVLFRMSLSNRCVFLFRLIHPKLLEISMRG